MSSAAYHKLRKWIERPLPRWELLYRATRDGFSAAKFHELCDDKGKTVSMARIKYDGSPAVVMLGGYCTRSWGSSATGTNVYAGGSIARGYSFVFGNLLPDDPRVGRTTLNRMMTVSCLVVRSFGTVR